MALDDVHRAEELADVESVTTTGLQVAELLSFFTYGHLTDENLRAISARCALLARTLADEMDHGEEFLAGLRKLLEAKDCFVRQALVTARATASREAE